MVVVETQYTNKQGQVVQLQTPRIRLDSTMGVNEQVQIQILSDIKNEQKTINVNGQMKVIQNMYCSVNYNQVQHYAKLTYGLMRDLQKYQYQGNWFTITRTFEGGKTILKATPIGNVPSSQPQPVYQGVQMQPQPVMQQKVPNMASTGLSMPPSVNTPVQQNVPLQGLQPTPSLMPEQPLQQAQGYTEVGKKIIVSMLSPMYRTMMGGIAQDYYKWRAFMMNQDGMKGQPVPEPVLQELYREFSIAFNNPA